MSKYFTTTELAAQIGVSRITVYNRVKAGKIPSELIGNRYLIPRKVAEQIILEHNAPMEKQWIENAVKMVLSQYGDVMERLAKE